MQVGDGGSGQIAVLNEWRWQDNERGGWEGTRGGTVRWKGKREEAEGRS